MLQSFKDWLVGKWQQRFLYGININSGAFIFGRYKTGGCIVGLHLLEVSSIGSAHWPWCLFEFALQVGHMPAWHIGLLGFTVGQCRAHKLEEDGSIGGPDFMKFYFMFKGINHQHQTLEEII